MSDSDYRASVPKWYRSYIVRTHGKSVMDKFDYIGKIHDINLLKDPSKYKDHNRVMLAMMKREGLPYIDMILPVKIGFFIYWTLLKPIKPIRKLYWIFINKK